MLVLLVRPDPKRIAELLAADDDGGRRRPPRRCSEILRRPGVQPAMLAALASFGVMVSVMNLTGYVVVEHHHHAQSTCSRSSARTCSACTRSCWSSAR